ncbi:MAG: hypothetical protein M3Q95_00815 [Bacteroidota bacterium]|nr:hypothetical protein [Bacteroidota bacterium]
MKTKYLIVLAIAMIAFTAQLSAQKINLESGSIAELIKEKKINIQYDYSDFKVGKAGSEADYVAKKVGEYNKEEAGKGDKWQTGWIDARKNRYEPKFEELINKMLEDKGIVHGSFPEAKYTLIVKTTFLEPGFNVGVMKQPAYVSFEFTFVETASPSTVVAKMSLLKVVGSQVMGYDFDSGSRISESYAKAGKILGKYLAN